ncbi:hypothetical protein AWB71_05973 [Caballeronia peredens]|nr:hypothetical protein AWB71_05973 [Caballeronia peredens]
MKQAKKEPDTAPERGRDTQRRDDAAGAPLPHEADQNVESQHEHEARDVGKQAHEDIERGLVDTDEPLRGFPPGPSKKAETRPRKP